MREGRRFTLGVLFIVTLALLSLTSIPLVHADADAVEESSGGAAEAVVDATGDVQVEEPESSTQDEDDGSAAAEAEAAAAAEEAEAAATAEAEAVAAKAAAAAEAASAVVDEVEEKKGGAFVSDVAASAKSKATALVDKAKSVTPEQMKKVAAGAIGIWGVAAGAGWVMNNLGGAEE